MLEEDRDNGGLKKVETMEVTVSSIDGDGIVLLYHFFNVLTGYA